MVKIDHAVLFLTGVIDAADMVGAVCAHRIVVLIRAEAELVSVGHHRLIIFALVDRRRPDEGFHCGTGFIGNLGTDVGVVGDVFQRVGIK